MAIYAGILLLLTVACRQPLSTAQSNQQTINSTLPPPPQLITPTSDAGIAVSTIVPAMTVESLPTVTPAPTEPAAPLQHPTATTTPPPEYQLATSPNGQPVTAYRVGQGEINIVVVGFNHPLVAAMRDFFRAEPQEVPPDLTVWFVPEWNPDGLDRVVDLRRNAGTDLDGCPDNRWQPNPDDQPGAGGAYPFSEPESRALDTLLQSSWLTLFYEQADSPALLEPRLVPGSCLDYKPNVSLNNALSQATNMPIARGEADSGNWLDYLTGEGIAAARIEMPASGVNISQQVNGLKNILNDYHRILAAETITAGAELTWLDGGDVGSWHFAPNTFIHPLAMTVIGQNLFMLDSGRVLQFDLNQPAPPQIILQPGDIVANEWVAPPVQEPLDMIAINNDLLLLDRVGDIYRYHAGIWTVERYDRNLTETSSHYFTAVAAGFETRYLLETSYAFINRYHIPYAATDSGWQIGDQFDVDLMASGEDVYLLYRGIETPAGGLVRYQDVNDTASRNAFFRPTAPIFRPRQLAVSSEAITILDRAGYRLLRLDSGQGQLRQILQFRHRQPLSAIWTSPQADQMIMAGKDTLYFMGQPEQKIVVRGGATMPFGQLHDENSLHSLQGSLQTPIVGSPLTRRDLQMPGAPRHYRLGIHEGLDFYWAAGTPVIAAADGIVIRALQDYIFPEKEQIEQWRDQSLALGITSPEALDGFRGQQVWVEHANGLVTRYVHLGGIEPWVVEGVQVSKGQVIASVGNSGSPGAYVGEGEDYHLHFEVWLGDNYLGKYLRPVEAREWFEQILSP